MPDRLPATMRRQPQPSDSAAPRRPMPLPRYDRIRDLPRLVPLWPSEIADGSAAGLARLVQRLRKALREERRRGLAGHWAYDLGRHAALYRAYGRELEALRAASRATAEAGLYQECGSAASSAGHADGSSTDRRSADRALVTACRRA